MSANRRTFVLDQHTDIYSVIQNITEIPNKDDPFYICDVSKLIGNIKNWNTLIPRVEVFYAVKSNDSHIVIETLAALGTGFDCASMEEIRKILALGVPPEKIIFSNPTKLDSHISYAAEVGVTVMTFDSELELHKIKKLHLKADLVLRIRFDDKTARFVLGKKFGANSDAEAINILRVAKSLDLNVIGIHFHVGSDCKDYSTYYGAIKSAKKFFEIGSEIGYKFKLLDIGGGFPGESLNPLEEVAGFINKGINEHFTDDTVKIIAEPGNYCCNAAFKLVSQIHSKNIVTDAEKTIRKYYLDVGFFSGFFNVIFQVFYACRPVVLNKESQLLPSILWGPTLHKKDRISKKIDYLPDMKIGDWLIFDEIGGYSLAISCEYQSLALPSIYAIINRNDWLLMTENIAKPQSKEKFTTSLDKFLTKQDIPYSFKNTYF